MKNHYGEVTFSSADDGRATRVVWQCRFDAKLPGTGGLMKLIIRRVFSDTLHSLERVRFSSAGL